MPRNNPLLRKKLRKKFGSKNLDTITQHHELITPSNFPSTITKHTIPKRKSTTPPLTIPAGPGPSTVTQQIQPKIDPNATTPEGVPIDDATILSEDERYKPKKIINGVPIQKDGTILERLPANVSPPPGSVPFYERANAVVQPNESAIILTITPTPSKLLYLRSIGHTFYDGQEEFFLITDGTVWKRWNYQIGTPVNLYTFQGTLSAMVNIQFGVLNQSPVARNYEMVGDGWEVIIRMLHSSENIN